MYTTPLKALSNQKYQDLQRRFGRERVGLMTGDACLNAEAEVLVMTTEVFRNMLLEDDQARLAGVAYVVLDEFHYMNDASRGTVWEESCILTPPAVRLIALSATMSNADQIVEWLGEIHGHITRTTSAVLLAVHADHRDRRLRTHAPTHTAPETVQHHIADHRHITGAHVR